jgi:hypothetical protein
VARLRRSLVGRGLVLCLPPDLPPRLDAQPFDRVLRFRRGLLQEDDGPAPALQAVPA